MSNRILMYSRFSYFCNMNKLYASVTFLLVVLSIFSCGEKQEGIQAEYKSITHSIYASVVVKPSSYYTVYPQQSGIISEVFVTEGDTVYAGQKIGSMQKDNIEVNKEKAIIQYQLAESKLFGKSNTLKSILSEISALKSQVRFDSINYFKNLELLEEGVVSESTVDNYKLKYDLSGQQLNSLEERYNQEKKYLNNSLKMSKADLKAANISLNDSYLYSLVDGKIYNVHKEIGEFISPQTPFAEIGSRDQFVLEMHVDEEDITKIKVGQRVIVSLEAYPDTTFDCEVSKIYPQKDLKNETFVLEGIFLEKPKALLSGMSGESNIIIKQAENVLVIPRSYLSNQNEVKTDDGMKEVKVGLKSLEFVEILGGIDEKTTIYRLDED